MKRILAPLSAVAAMAIAPAASAHVSSAAHTHSSSVNWLAIAAITFAVFSFVALRRRKALVKS
jgi:hypothetical protein